MKTIVFDNETTGLLKHPSAKLELQPKVIEFGAALLDQKGKRIREIDLLINPGEPLEEIITKITGITDDDLQDAPTFGEVLPQIQAMFLEADVMIAHNLPFDKDVLGVEIRRLNETSASPIVMPWPAIGICTVAENMDRYGYRIKLQDLYRDVTGKPFQQSHRALDDVNALVEVVLAGEYIENLAAAIAG